MRKEIRLSGFGGQGVGLAGLILGRAICLFDEHEVVLTQSYGPEARGGASSTNIVVSDQPIDYPLVQQADVLVAMSQESYTRFRPEIHPDAVLIVDQDLVTPAENDRVYSIPATRIAEGLGKRIVANMVMLGYLTSITGCAKRESVQKAIETSVRRDTVALNLQAFAAGFEYKGEKVAEG